MYTCPHLRWPRVCVSNCGVSNSKLSLYAWRLSVAAIAVVVDKAVGTACKVVCE